MSMSEKAADVINQSAHRKFQTEYIPLVESAEVVSSRISSAAAALNSMYGVRQSSQLNEVTEIPEPPEIDSRVNTYLTRYSQGKTINESTNQDYEFQPGDVVQTIKQGQQLGTVEKNDGLKVYHRHENGRLYASGASNLKLIKKASDNTVEESTQPTRAVAFGVLTASGMQADSQQHTENGSSYRINHGSPEIFEKIVSHVRNSGFKNTGSSKTDINAVHNGTGVSLRVNKDGDGINITTTNQHVVEQTTQEPTSLQESINNILQQLNIESIDQLDESAQKELISIALDLTI